MTGTVPPKVGQDGGPGPLRGELDSQNPTSPAHGSTAFSDALKQQGSDGGSIARVQLPTVAESVGSMTAAQRAASEGLVKEAAGLAGAAKGGAPATELAKTASDLFEKVQGSTLAPADAKQIEDHLRAAKAAIYDPSSSYQQGLVIPLEQSQAEGMIDRTADLMGLAARPSPA